MTLVGGELVSGIVRRGEQQGRRLGFPTANLGFAPGAAVPEFGTYAGLVDGRPAAVSLGVRPTFGEGLEPLLEAHILDYDGDDLYGTTIDVELLERIRRVARFDSVAELVDAIERGVLQVRNIVAARGLRSADRGGSDPINNEQDHLPAKEPL